MKDFTDSTKIVAIRTSGNVYSAKVVDELNRKQKNWTDLITGEKFRAKDIIVLQDPLQIKMRLINEFKWKQDGVGLIEADKEDEDEGLRSIEMTGLGKRALEQAEGREIDEVNKRLNSHYEAKSTKKWKKKEDLDLDELLTVQDFLEERKHFKDWRHSRQSTGKVAASVTSSLISVQTRDEMRCLTDAEMLHEIWYLVKSNHIKSYISITTNLGTLNCVLFSNQAARTCFSFLNLCNEKKFEKLKFGKIVENTIIQFGEGKASKLRLDTVDKSEKLLHDRGGLLTVETSGNISTLGITLAASKQLDFNYSVFGRIVGGFEIIKNVSDFCAEGSEHLLTEFVIESIDVVSDGFQEGCRRIRRRIMGIDKKKEKELEKKEKADKRRATLNRILMQ